jgi:ribosome biogenesis GTPase
LTTLAALGFDAFFAAQLERLAPSGWIPARVASEGRNSFHLLGSGSSLGELSGRLRRGLSSIERPVCGDWVAVEESGGRAVIHHVFERRTALVRRAPGTESAGQVLAANVDVFFVVTSPNQDFNERRLERYVTAVWNSGAAPVVVLNKIDLGGDFEQLREAVERVAIDVPVVLVSASSGEGLDDLRAHTRAGWTVGFIGSSGVGKSSLMNRLLGQELQSIGDLRVGGQKGRHTTTARQLVELPGGGLLIDTPGMREIGLVEDIGGIEMSFSDVAAFAERCRFRDCKHAGEPGCAVAAAVESGELDGQRLASYQKLLREIAAVERSRDPILAGRSKQRWKAIHKAMRARAKIDPKAKQ